MAKSKNIRKSNTVNIQSIFDKKVSGRVSNALGRVLSRRNMAGYMDETADIVRKRTRLGYHAANTGDKRSKLKPLKTATIKQRKRFKRDGELSSITTPKRSNLTRTEQLLNALKGYGLGLGRGILKVKATSRSDSDVKNDDLAKYMSEKGRPFLNLTKKELKELGQNIKRDLVKRLTK